MGHTHNVTSVAFSPDGRYAISGSIDKTLKLWDIATGREIRTFSGITDRVTAVVISPDGRYALSGDEGVTGNIKLWNILSGKLIRTFSGHEGGMGAIAFSPDGKHILSAGGIPSDKTLKLWDVATGREIRTFRGSTAPVTSIAVTPDGKYIISGSWDNSVTPSQEPDGTFIEAKAKSTDNTIRVWEIATGRQVKAFHKSGGWVSTIVITPDGKYVISGHYEDSARMWEIASGRQVKVFDVGGVSSIAISPNGKYALFGGVMEMKLWDIAVGREIRAFKGLEGWVRSIAFSPDEKYVLSGDDSTTPKLWDIASGKETRAFGGYTQQVASVALSPDGNQMVMAQNYGLLNTWDISTGRQLKILKHTLGIKTVSISSDGSRVAAGGWDFSKRATTLKLWEMATGKETGTINKEGPYWIQSMAVGPDGKSVLWSDNTVLRLSDIASGREIKAFSGGHKFEILYAAMSADGRFAVSNDSQTTNIWDISTGRIMKSFKNEEVTQTVCSDGKRVLVISMDHNQGKLVFMFWDLSTNREIRTLHADYDTKIVIGNGWQGYKYINLPTMSSDGNLVLWSDNRTIHLWDTRSGKEIRTFSGHINDISSIGISPDEKYVYSGSHDGTTRLWDISTGKEVARMISFTDGEWVVITPEGYFNASPGGAKHLNVRVGNKVYGIDQFYARFYRPELVQLALAGKELPKGELITDIAAQKPAPNVQILSPVTNSSVDQDSVSITLKITDNGGGIGSVNVYLNGAQVANDTRGIIVKGKAAANERILSFTIPLIAGQNEIRAVAFNGENSMESNPALIKVISNAVMHKPNLYALVIGINKYRNQSISLTYAVPDAIAFAGTLQKVATPLFEKVDIRTLTTPEATTKDAISKAFEEVRQLVRPNDLFIFYNASHGMVDVVNGEEQYFLLTSNVRLLSSQHISKDALSHKDLVNLIGSIPAQKKLVILDTCNAGKGGKEIQIALLQQTRGLTDATAVKLLQRAVGSSVFSASADTQQALEGYKGHGLFTYVLLEGLQGKADFKKDGFITVKGLALHTEERVMTLSEEVFKRQQNPMIETGVNDFPIGRVK
ncbi:MAG: caspase family protein [Deltaproteobacteria bacterium]|nr:caspase family protein [Deltaproteobacteria bacterium]